MKRITRKEYLAAQRIVNQYEKQRRKGKYQFLYCLQEDSEDNMKAMYISDKNIDDACKKFMQKKPNDTVRVDYEVELNGTYIDITNQPDINELL